jgi:formylglycine-generating enzyme required for sulfatase activity/energy-coupling factor transporter ATP-binding protein EcfA2
MDRRNLRPYPGLRAFERAESRTFFGRQQQINDLLIRLKRHHFLAVLGTSGSGKSSLMKAGVLPKLEKGYMGEIGSRWSIAEMKPGDQPFANLAAALLKDKTFAAAWSAAQPSGTELTEQLNRGVRSLHEILRLAPLPEGTRLLLLVDQFEELFRFRKYQEDQATSFVALLLEACSHPDVYVAITMRSDFLGAAAEFHGLPEFINDGLYLTPRLPRDQLHDAICLPARLFGGTVEDALANHLLNEAGNDPDQLPLLQHALMRLWDTDKTLTLAAFQSMNGLRGALNGHAEQAWDDLDAQGKIIAEVLFRALTERSRDGQDTRRPMKMQAILELISPPRNDAAPTVRIEDSADWTALVTVIDTFRQAGRNFLMPSPSVALTPDTVLDISHESLIRQWVRLQAWVKAEAESAVMYLRLLDAAQRHANHQGECWRGTDLALALDWQAVVQPNAAWATRYGNAQDFALTVAFLQESVTAEQQREAAKIAHLKSERRRERQQKWLAAVAICFVAAAGLAVWGFSERNKAQLAEGLATDTATRAMNAEQYAKRETQKATLASQQAAQDAARATKAETFAKQFARKAVLARTEAQQEALRAHQAEELAQIEAQKAKQEKIRAEVAEVQTNQAQVELIGFTLSNLIKQNQVITPSLQGVFKRGQQGALFAWIKGLIDKTDALDAAAKQDWRGKLPTLAEDHLMQLIRLLFADATDNQSDMLASLAQEIRLVVPKVSAGVPDMVSIPAGSLVRGDAKNAQTINLAKFEIGKYEVTQGQWRAVMGSNPSSFKDCGDTCPVEKVSWEDAQLFIQKLNTQTGKTYRLPSEAEWEYACRANGKGTYCGGDAVYAEAWFDGNSDQRTHTVGRKQPNAFGLYDMSGNVWEWVQDSYHENYQGAPLDGKAWESKDKSDARVRRGGSWDYDARYVSTAIRGSNAIVVWSSNSGFRLARTLP